MPVSPARIAAFDILLRVEQEDAYASELLHSTRYRKLSPADHGLTTELLMGVLRWRSLLDGEIARFSSQKLEKLDPELLAALRLAAYQLLCLDRVPARAAVHESVELVKRARKRSAVPFANAVLRKLGEDARRRGLTGGSAVEHSAQPHWLTERWVQEFGKDVTGEICAHNQRAPETAVYLSSAEVEEELKDNGIELSGGRLLASARRVQSGDVTHTAAFRQGRIVILDEASQLVALLVGKGSRMLDCCAAPGGKTRLLAERNPRATIVAVELHPHRARLQRRLMPATNVHVLAADMRQLPLSASFDRVLVDVPCSGTGTLARHPEIKWRLRPEDLPDLQSRQLAILRSAMKQVAPGGRLVYSTCSLEGEENGEVVEKALAAHPAFRVVACKEELERLRLERELVWKDIDSLTKGPYLRTLPGIHPCDGFFAAILERN